MSFYTTIAHTQKKSALNEIFLLILDPQTKHFLEKHVCVTNTIDPRCTSVQTDQEATGLTSLGWICKLESPWLIYKGVKVSWKIFQNVFLKPKVQDNQSTERAISTKWKTSVLPEQLIRSQLLHPLNIKIGMGPIWALSNCQTVWQLAGRWLCLSRDSSQA